MIDFDFKSECTGCRACADICPQGCISFSEDHEGFAMPFIKKADCVDCGLCERVCPALNHKVSNYDDRKCYAVYHKREEIRHIGSSGSVFYALAEQIILSRGVVYGAAFDKDLQLHHTRATDIETVRLQMKSKYIQSDTEGVYKQVLKDLREGKEVLFVGTPCQCQALHNMTPARLRDQLLIADIICHGVPSQNLFNQSIKHFEKEHKCKVTCFSFREKSNASLRNYRITYAQEDGIIHEEQNDLYVFPFCNGYLNHFTLRVSCYTCKQRGIQRESDLTLGDFWGIKEIHPGLSDFEKGYSSIIVNTDKGKQVVEQLSSCVVEEIRGGVQFVTAHNRAYTKPDEKSLMRKVFFCCLHHCGYGFCEKHFLTVPPSLLGRILNSAIIRIDKIKK